MSLKYFSKLIKRKEGERIIKIIRRCGLTLWPKIFFIIILLALDFFFLYFLFKLGTIGIIIFSFVLLVILFYTFKIFRIWYYNVFIITNKRIIDIDQRGILNRIVSESPLNKIKDVSYRIKGFWPTIFRYGNLEVQMASDLFRIEVRKIKNPRAAQGLLLRLKEKY